MVGGLVVLSERIEYSYNIHYSKFNTVKSYSVLLLIYLIVSKVFQNWPKPGVSF